MVNQNRVMVLVGMAVMIGVLLACAGGASQAPAATTEAPTAQESGGPSSSGGTMPSISPCTVVTKDEAAAFFGVPSADGDSSVGSLTAECDYRSTDNADGLSLILAYVQQGSAVSSDQFKYMTKDAQAVPGLGEGAFWVPAGNLDVAKGSWILTLNGAMGGKNVGVDKLTPLAQTALARLP